MDFHLYLTMKITNKIIKFSALTAFFLHHTFKDINRGPKNKHHTDQPGEIPNTQQNAFEGMRTMAIFSKNKIFSYKVLKRLTNFMGK